MHVALWDTVDSDERGHFSIIYFVFVWVNEFKKLFKGRRREWVGMGVGGGGGGG